MTMQIDDMTAELERLVDELPPARPDETVRRRVAGGARRRRARNISAAIIVATSLAFVAVGIGTHATSRPAAIVRTGSGVGTVAEAPSTSRPASDSTDAKQITDAFLGWIDTKPRDAVGAFVEDFAGIRSSILHAAATAPLPVDDYTGRVDSVTMIDAAHANVVYDFLNGGAVVVPGQHGVAVKIGGVWRVTRETVCEALAIGGTQCPPRSP
jgi:hypothetical protein